MDYSLPAWFGGLIGTIIAVVIYIPAIRVLERSLRAQSAPQTAAERTAFEDKLSVTRRVILGLAIAVFATAGYFVGNAIGLHLAARALGGMRG